MKPPTPDSVARDLALFVAPNQYAELRALHVGGRGRTFAGFFAGTHLRDMARHALALSRQAAGVYFTPNPVDPRRAATRLNRVLDVHKGFSLTHDSDVLERRYLVIDLDPRRYAFDPETDAYLPTQDLPTTAREFGFTRRAARAHVVPFLADLGFPAPVQMCSGNGVHLVYRIDAIPGGKVGGEDPSARILTLLDSRFSCAGFTIDTNTYNPCRMLKVPGTLTRRGDATASRPYRTARLIEVPNDWPAPAAIDARYDLPASGPGPGPEPERKPPVVAAPVAEGGQPERRARPDRPREKVGAKPAGRKPAAKPAAGAGLFDPGRSGKPSH